MDEDLVRPVGSVPALRPPLRVAAWADSVRSRIWTQVLRRRRLAKPAPGQLYPAAPGEPLGEVAAAAHDYPLARSGPLGSLINTEA